MDNIYNLLQGLLKPLGEEDQAFVKSYWDVILKCMLTPYQHKIEADLSYDILTTQTQTKTFYESFIPVANDVHYNITSLPVTLPYSIYDLKCYGDEYTVTESMALPVRIFGATNISCDCPNVVIDGDRVIGEGTWTVMYTTNEVTDFTFVNGVLDGPTPIHDVDAKQGTGSLCRFNVVCEILMNKGVFCESINTKYMTVGMGVVISGHAHEIAEIVDAHKFRTVALVALPGTHQTLEIDLYPYSYATDIDDIRLFRDGKRKDVDFVMRNGSIAFPTPQRDPMITERAYRNNTDVLDRFMHHLATYPDDESLWLPYWRSIFTNQIDIFLYAAIGYPYTLPEMGDMRVVNIEYSVSDKKHETAFTNYEANDQITTAASYFDGNENGIVLTDGTLLKIVRGITDDRVELFRVPFAETAVGFAANIVVSSIGLEDEYGKVTYFPVPAGQFPLFKIGDFVTPWSMLVTGLKVFDRTERDDYTDFEGIDKFKEDPTGGAPADALDLLAMNTFVILSDETISVTDNIMKFLIGAWTQWHMLDGRGDSIGIRDISAVGAVASLVFRKFLPWEIVNIVSAFNVLPRMQHQALIEPDMPLEFLGDYDGITQEITNLTWTDGITPLDITLWPNVDKVSEAFGTNLDSELAAGGEIVIFPGAGKLIINTMLTGVYPSVGVGIHFSFLKALKATSVDVYMDKGGIFWGSGEEVARGYNGTKAYFVIEQDAFTEYTPSIYSLSDLAFADEIKFEYSATNGTRVVGALLADTDFKRLGVRAGMTFVHIDDILEVASFDEWGQPTLSPASAYGTLSSDFGFYCFVARSNDGTISKN